MVPTPHLVAALAAAGLGLGLASGPLAQATTHVSEPTPVGAADAKRQAPMPGWRGWVWPLAPEPEVERPFDAPRRRWEPGHRGVDLRASVGQEVRSPAAGEVAFAARLAGRSVLVVRHPGGLRSTFEPVVGSLPVGSPVAPGEVIGLVTDESTHCDPATCLHWGVLRGREYLDPLVLLRRAPVILLPLE
ncbi:M23 family metallopeptidase [Intrasporangium calvum]|uniref:M23 family metallopeptidase n=1 Tax=Intrasporangium calvum TaxID=53358 RepID=UPI000DF62907|nr:M23 family metallopeptidase [Intrasporangium calvum]AXG13776.1 M23 family peptidase [Intrasporangium calvum]